jgi:hypothetical protein
MFLAWILEIAKTLGYALLMTVIFVVVRTTLLLWGTNAKAVGIAVIRAYGVPVMLVGFFTIVLGFVLARIDLVSDGGRLHVTFLR